MNRKFRCLESIVEYAYTEGYVYSMTQVIDDDGVEVIYILGDNGQDGAIVHHVDKDRNLYGMPASNVDLILAVFEEVL